MFLPSGGPGHQQLMCLLAMAKPKHLSGSIQLCFGKFKVSTVCFLTIFRYNVFISLGLIRIGQAICYRVANLTNCWETSGAKTFLWMWFCCSWSCAWTSGEKLQVECAMFRGFFRAIMIAWTEIKRFYHTEAQGVIYLLQILSEKINW